MVNSLKRRGAEEQLFNFIKELPDAFDVNIFRFSNAEDEFPELFQYNGVEIYSNKYKGMFNLLKFIPLYDCFTRQKYDVVVTIGLGAALFLGRLSALTCGIRMIYSFCNTLENFHNLPKLCGDYFDFLNKGLNLFITRITGNRIYRFLPNSKILSEKIRYCTNKYPIRILYNGYIRDEFEQKLQYTLDEKIKEIKNKIDGHPTIIQVGALDENKNQIFTIQSIQYIKKLMPNIRFLIIGDGEKKKEWKEWSRINDLGKQIIFAGQIGRFDCLRLISSSNLLVLTSKSESFPNVIAESQAVSVPVVSFDVGAASEIIEHGKTGYLIQKNDVKSFQNRILTLLKDKELAIKMGQIGKKKVFDHFSIDKKVKKFISMVEEDYSLIKCKYK